MLWHQIVPQPRVIDPQNGAVAVTFPIPIDGVDRRHTALLDRVNRAASRILGVAGAVYAAGESGGAEAGGAEAGESGAGGYTLTVSADRVVLRTADDSGIAAGLATLTQALLLADSRTRTDAAPDRDGAAGGSGGYGDGGAARGSEGRANPEGGGALRGDGGAAREGAALPGAALPAVEIVDTPATEWRGFMLDVARHFFPVETLERMTDILWLLRLNRFHLHLTDDQGWRLPVPEYPALTETGGYRHDGTTENGRYGGSYTLEELQRIDREAALLGITVVPEIDLPGHASAALTAYPDLSCNQRAPGVQTEWGIFSHVLCTTRSETKQFLRTVCTAVRDTFTGSYIHIGGDEVPGGAWQECPACSRRDDPYQDIVREMAELVIELGRRPVAWDEASRLDLPRSTIIVNWRRPADAAAALDRGYDLVLAPERRAAYLDHKHRDTTLEPGRLGVCTVADSAAFAPQAYVADHVSVGESSESGGAGAPSTSRAPLTSRILGGQANLWTEELLYHAHIEYMGIVRLAAVAAGLWSGEPAREDETFFPNLDRFRRRLSEQGYAVYTGPFSSEVFSK